MIDLFDAQAGFGGGRRGQPWVPSVEELLGHMERLSVARALVRTEFEEMDRESIYSNRLLYEACAERGDLVPCPAVMPTGHGDVPSEQEQIDELLAHGAGAATLRPGTDSWSLAPWCCGTLLGLLEEHRIPVLCRASALDYDAVADLAGRHPELPIVMFQLGYRSLRSLFSLMEAFPNVYLSVGSPWSVHLGLESLSARVGTERLLFGTGFPYSEPMAGITMLTYSELGDADKQLVGAGNLDRLIGGIRR
jgi:predicted TIM-barrel fold metal-dependent hydrolase